MFSSQAESKVDLVSKWRQMFPKDGQENQPNEVKVVMKRADGPRKRKKYKSKAGKASVGALLSKLEHVPTAHNQDSDTVASNSTSHGFHSFLVPEDRLKLDPKHLSVNNEDAHDNGTVGSYGDVSILSHQSQSTLSSVGLGLSNQLANKAFQIDVMGANGAQIRCERTIHEMIYEIETAAKSKRPPPTYVSRLNELDPSILAWDGNSSKKSNKSSSRKPRRLSTLSINTMSTNNDVATVGSMASIGSHGTSLRSNSLGSNSNDGVGAASVHRPGREQASKDRRSKVQVQQSRSMSGVSQLSESDSLSSLPSVESLLMSKSASSSSSAGVNVNMLGCLKSIELVLAQAEQRSRKMQMNAEAKEKMCEEQRVKLEALIQEKMARAERHAAEISLAQRQMEWLRIMVMCCCLHRVLPFSAMKRALQHHHPHLHAHLAAGGAGAGAASSDVASNNPAMQQEAAVIISRAFRRWYERRMYIKYRVFFTQQLRKHRMAISLGLRIYRKRKAVKRIKSLLIACQGYQKLQMKQVVTNFLKSVRFIQKYIRSFLACKRARLEAIGRLWEKIEYPYIKRKLKEREELRNVAVTNKRFELPAEYISEQARIELKAQAKKWTAIDGKMEESLQKHRTQGNLKQATTEEVIQKLKAPDSARLMHLKEIVESKRKEYMLRREAEHKAHVSKISVFSPEDAMNLIHGREDVADKIVKKVGLKIPLLSRQRDPFTLYRKLPHQLVFNRIKKTHEDLETFVIKLDKDGSSKFAKRYAKLREYHDGKGLSDSKAMN